MNGMNPRYNKAIIVISGSIGCYGFLSGVICGIVGYQTAGIDLCVVGFLGTAIGGTLAMLDWSEKD